MATFHGACHCGNIEVRFETEIAPADFKLRACDCTFCRKHGVRTVMDPKGRARIEVRDGAWLTRYQFGLATADYFVCKRCGAYAGAVLTEAAGAWAVINVNLLDDQSILPREAQVGSYGSETAESRSARRRMQWTPVTVKV
ncbi:MAG TPA: hypothetical protein VH083_23445 [Myxococcales bacterium]|nr:hypothetical protein [Myxococcales bacterium]